MVLAKHAIHNGVPHGWRPTESGPKRSFAWPLTEPLKARFENTLED